MRTPVGDGARRARDDLRDGAPTGGDAADGRDDQSDIRRERRHRHGGAGAGRPCLRGDAGDEQQRTDTGQFDEPQPDHRGAPPGGRRDQRAAVGAAQQGAKVSDRPSPVPGAGLELGRLVTDARAVGMLPDQFGQQRPRMRPGAEPVERTRVTRGQRQRIRRGVDHRLPRPGHDVEDGGVTRRAVLGEVDAGPGGVRLGRSRLVGDRRLGRLSCFVAATERGQAPSPASRAASAARAPLEVRRPRTGACHRRHRAASRPSRAR